MKQILQTNFVDDILSDSMGGKRRFNLIPNNDGTYSLEDVTEYDQLGSQFGSANINATNNAVNESADKNKMLETLAEINATTEAGYMADALAIKELTNSLTTKPLNVSFGTLPTNVTKAENLLIYRVGNVIYGTFLVGLSASGNYVIPFNMEGLRVQFAGPMSFTSPEISGNVTYDGSKGNVVTILSSASLVSASRGCFTALIREI